MPKAVWTGSLTFGLVTIPVRLYPATEPKDVRFHLTDSQGRRVRYRRFVEGETPEHDWAPSDVPPPDAGSPSSGTPRQPNDVEEEIAYEDLMRGVEREDGSVVLLGGDEIRSIQPERSRTIDIEDFVDLGDIDPVYFEKSYVVAPQHGAEKPYALLVSAMERSGRAGIGRFVLRTKPHLVAIRPADGTLALETLFFGDEVRDARRLVGDIGAVQVSERELELAEKLIATLKTTWNPEAYADTYREELLERIAQKEPAQIPEERSPTPSGSQVEALMNVLKASVEEAKKKQTKRSTRKRTA
ncbi:MAG: Ku protein [Actinomycetota bacterium]|nr:Ku protein [Actinomycetota bacterium]